MTLSTYSNNTFRAGFGHMSPELVKGCWVFLSLKKIPSQKNTWAIPEEGRWNMARQSQNKFIKRQKELERMRKAKEKMARRQSKKDKTMEADDPRTSDQSSQNADC